MYTPSVEPSIWCILVNWNGCQDTSDCLKALAKQLYPNLFILVVDNGSADDSVFQFQTHHPEVHVLSAGANLGFPKACNLGAHYALAHGAEFLWFLNNDTVPASDTATKLMAQAENDLQVGIVGSVLYYLHDPARIQAWGGGTVSLWTGFSSHFEGPASFGRNTYLTFASVLVRRSAFEQLGGLSEAAFMYFEDTDFCLRARAAGWQLAVAGSTRILHKEGGSSERRSPRLDRMVTSAGLNFLNQHAPVPAISRTLYLSMRLGRRIVHGDWTAVRAVIRGANDWRAGRANSLAAAE